MRRVRANEPQSTTQTPRRSVSTTLRHCNDICRCRAIDCISGVGAAQSA